MKTRFILVSLMLAAGTARSQPGIESLQLRTDLTSGARGGRLTLTHTVSNAGPETATNVWVTNQLPTGVSWHGMGIATRPALAAPEVQLRTTPLSAGVTFAPPQSPAFAPAVSLAVADLDLDGWPDIIAAHGTNAENFSVWRTTPQGDVVFVPIPPSPIFSQLRDVTVGDFNGDGNPDIAGVTQSGTEITAWYENGDAPDFNFFPASMLAFPTPITKVLACDFDGDGYSDLVALEPAVAQLHLLGHFGVLGFMEVGALSCPTNPVTFVAAPRAGPEVECAALPDLYVTANSSDGVVSVFQHVCPGGGPVATYFEPRVDYACGPEPGDLAVADLDADGRLDLVVATGANLTLLKAGEVEGFEAVGTISTSGARAGVRVWDIDGDAMPELIVGHDDQPYLTVIPNTRAKLPLSPEQFRTAVTFALPAPFNNIGSGPCLLDPLGRSTIVVGHTEGGGPGPPGGGASFSMLRLTQPGAEVSFSLGDLGPGHAVSADLELEVGMADATNSTFVTSRTGSGPSLTTSLPLATVCGRLFCVSEGATRVIPGATVHIQLGGSWLTYPATARTASNGRFCAPFPFACGQYPAGSSITITSSACPGKTWVFPASVLYAAQTIPSLYCTNCPPCEAGSDSFQLFTGRNDNGLLPFNSADVRFTVTGQGFNGGSAYVVPGVQFSWVTNGPDSRWVAPEPSFTLPLGVYAYEARFFLPCENHAQITGRWTADDTGTIFLNGAATGVALPPTQAHGSWYPVSITSGFLPGWNTLTFYVTNVDAEPLSPTGLRAELTGTADCCGGCLEVFCPAPICVTSTSNCVPVQYNVRVENPCCDKTAVSCFPPSGSLFPLGTTMVQCLASDICGSRKACSFTVTVQARAPSCIAPAIVSGPAETVAPQNTTATLSVTASGTPPLSYQWQRSGTNLPGATSSTLVYPNVQRPQSGHYSVVVSNACGSITSLVAQLLVSAPVAADPAVSVEVLPFVHVGTNFTCVITVENIGNTAASGMTLSAVWNSAQIGLVSGPAGAVFGFPPQAITMSIGIASLPVGGMTNFDITLNAGGVGSVSFGCGINGDPTELNFANNAAVAVTGFGHRPGITQQPLGVNGAPATSGSMSLTATGTPALAYFWQRDGLDVGPNGPLLNFPDMHSSDAGGYVCVVSNAWGTATSAVAVVTFAHPAQVTAAVDGGQTLRVVGSTGVDDIEVRLEAGNPNMLQITNHGSLAVQVFPVNSFNRLVIELGDQNNRLIFNDANGRVTALNKSFEIHGGSGSNLVVASSTGLDLTQLPALLGTLNAAPDFEALAQGLYDQANTNLLTPSVDWVGQLYTNMTLTAQMLLAMAQTNVAAQASNLVGQANSLSQVASNCVNDALCRFADSSLATSLKCDEFTNCLFMLIRQLEAIEDSASMTNTTNSSTLTGIEDQAEAISDQMEDLIEAHEQAADLFELGMDARFDTGSDAFNARIESLLEGPGEGLGETNGPAFEALAEAFEALAEQLLEMQAEAVESQADAMNLKAQQLEAAAITVALQAQALETAAATFTLLADPPPSGGGNNQFIPAAAPATGTNAGCDRNIGGSQPWILFDVGGLIIGTPTNDQIRARNNTTLILGLGGDDLIFGNTNFNVVFGGGGNDEIHGLGGVDLLFGDRDHDCIFGDDKFDLIFGGSGDDNLHGGTNIDLIIGWTGNDKIFGDDNFDILLGWDGVDEMHGGPGIDVMFGGLGIDTMYGDSGFKFTNDIPFVCKFELGNVMLGGDNNDIMHGGDGFDVIFGLFGDDTIYCSNQVDVVFGGAGNDRIYGGDGGPLFYILVYNVTNGVRLGNLLFGNGGNDTLEGGMDIDLLFGGPGEDNVRGSYAYDVWDYPPISFDCGVVDYGFDIDLIFGGTGNDTLDGCYDSDLIFGGKGDDIIFGNGETNRLFFPETGLLFGGTNSDLVIGGTNDLLTLAFGGKDDDYVQGSKFGVMNLLFGGPGGDGIDGYGDLITLSFGGRDDDVMLGGGVVLDLMFGGPGKDWMHAWFGLIDLMFGNAGDDEMHGGISVLKLMFGNPDNDTMKSGIGAVSVMFGNRGCDRMTNNALVGLAFGNREQDMIYGEFPALVEIFFGNADDDYIEGAGLLDVLFGNAGNDTIQSGPILNLVFGNLGDDTIHGANGVDLLFGNRGDDRINGNGAPDIIFGGWDKDRIDGGNAPDLIFSGKSDDIVVGGDGQDLIWGGLNNDFLYGDSHLDLIFGGTAFGQDVIHGGAGPDFMFGRKGTDYLDGGNTDDKDRLWGGPESDYLVARGTGSRMRGRTGDDQFEVLDRGSMHVHGGKGSDTYEEKNGGTASKKTSVDSGTVNITFPVPMCAEIHGLVWHDLNENGIREPDEPKLVGIGVALYQVSSGTYTTNYTMADDPGTKADETGMYWFTMLPPGDYTWKVVPPPGYKQTFPFGNSSHGATLGPITLLTEKDFGIALACLTPPSGLVLWLPLDETTGSIAHNRAGGPNGTHVNNPSSASGLVNSSRCYELLGQQTVVPSHGLINFGPANANGVGDFTIDAWIRRAPTAGADVETIVDKRANAAGGLFGYVLYIAFNRLFLQMADGGISNFDSGLTVPADGKWHFVAVSVRRSDSQGGQFHVDANTSGFNPLSRSGSLVNNGPLLVGGPGNRPGCIDEVEVFNRALPVFELRRLFIAQHAGKCKVQCLLPAVAPFCFEATTVSNLARICNNGATTETFTYSFTGLPAGGACNVAGPTLFNAPTGSVTLGPGACANIPVVITKPAGMTGDVAYVQTACYKLTVTGPQGGEVATCTGMVTRPPARMCGGSAFGTLPFLPVYINADGQSLAADGIKATNVPVTFRNDGPGPMNFTARFSVAINDAPPVPVFSSPVALAAGASTEIILGASFELDDPTALHTVLIEIDLQGAGEFQPLSSFAVREVIQGSMRIDMEPAAGPAPLLWPSVTWSGFGILESAPSLPGLPGLPGTWNTVPGNPGSPYVPPLAPANTEFFRLRQ